MKLIDLTDTQSALLQRLLKAAIFQNSADAKQADQIVAKLQAEVTSQGEETPTSLKQKSDYFEDQVQEYEHLLRVIVTIGFISEDQIQQIRDLKAGI